MSTLTQNNYYLPVGKTDFNRMAMLNAIYQSYCKHFLIENGLHPGLHIADVGSGPGLMTLWLAEQVGPIGTVTAIDNSKEQLTILKQLIQEKNIDNIHCFLNDIYSLDEIQQSFDLIFCRFLLIHLSEPELAIKRLTTRLKPGGHLILAELDNSTWFSYPENQALCKDIDLLCETGRQKNADFCLGPKLYGLMRQNNFHSIKTAIAQPILLDEHREYLLLKTKAWAETYIDNNLITSTEFDALFQQLQLLVQNQDYLLAGAKMYLVKGDK